MPITTGDPRRARTIVTLTGMALTLLGGILWLVGDTNEVTGSNGMELHSSAAWGEVIGFQSDEEAEFDAAREQMETGETQMTVGVVLMVVGLAAVGSRWLIRPAEER
jgi:hypothetical protein